MEKEEIRAGNYMYIDNIKFYPKIREFDIKNVPVEFVDIYTVELLFPFLPIKTKYYKLIDFEIIIGDAFYYRNIWFKFEKLQNLRSYYGK